MIAIDGFVKRKLLYVQRLTSTPIIVESIQELYAESIKKFNLLYL
jgi:hypothetical protein